jgi:hypothetical protein
VTARRISPSSMYLLLMGACCYRPRTFGSCVLSSHLVAHSCYLLAATPYSFYCSKGKYTACTCCARASRDLFATAYAHSGDCGVVTACCVRHVHAALGSILSTRTAGVNMTCLVISPERGAIASSEEPPVGKYAGLTPCDRGDI